MNRLLLLISAAVLTLPLAACNSPAAPAPTHDDIVKTIQDLETQWVQDYTSKDAARLTAYYADDAVLMVPGSDPVSGKDAISKQMTSMVADPTFALRFHPTHVDTAASGDVAWSEGTYSITMTDPQSKQVVNDHGSYVTIYKKQSDGSWKALSDIANSSTPPAAPASAPAKTSPKKK